MRPRTCRVAVTGLGMVSALAVGARRTFEAVCAGKRGFSPVTLFDPGEQRCRIAAEVRGLDVAAIAPEGQESRFSRTDAMALLAAREALEEAGVLTRALRLGIALGGTTGGMHETELQVFGAPPGPLAPVRVARLMDHPLCATTEHLASAFGAVRTSTIVSACSSSGIAIAEALAWLESGAVDVVLAGGADGLCRLTFVGFNSLGATDSGPCRPFDEARQGLTLGEGAAFLALEREESARARGAEVLAFLAGASVLAEGHHITHPEPSGERAATMLRRAVEHAGLSLDAVGYVNAHGTGTRQNDSMEASALRRVFGDRVGRVLVSSSKSQLGHTLGAAGALEAAITVLSLQRGIVPPTSGLERPEASDLGHVTGAAKHVEIEVALSSSFGFGGMGSVLAFERASAEPRPLAARSALSVVVTGLGESTSDALTELDPERSRRFDAGAAGAALAATRALGMARLEAEETGLVVGSAYGNVDRSVSFLLRVAERGPKFANPAEFPHLVGSAAAGNASVYAGLRGPVLTASERERSGESAIARALSLLELGAANAVLAGAVSARDPIVDRVLEPLRSDGVVVPRGEGAAFLALEVEEDALSRGARVLARVLRHVELLSGAASALAEEGAPSARSALVAGAVGERLEAAIASSAWQKALRLSILERTGHHEAVGAFALSAAVALIAEGTADDVLVVSGLADACYLTRLVAPGRGSA